MTDREKIKWLIKDIADAEDRLQRIEQDQFSMIHAARDMGFEFLCEVTHDPFTQHRSVKATMRKVVIE